MGAGGDCLSFKEVLEGGEGKCLFAGICSNRECRWKASLVGSMTRTLLREGQHKLQPVFEFFVISTLRISECFSFFNLRMVD